MRVAALPLKQRSLICHCSNNKQKAASDDEFGADGLDNNEEGTVDASNSDDEPDEKTQEQD
jgi:hypothetical protein